MLVYKDGRFYAGRSSFALVNGCKLNDAPPALYRNGINLYTSDEACMIDVNFEHGIGGAQGSMKDSLVAEELGKLSGTKIEQREYAGQQCWCAEYMGDLYKYFEARFDAQTGLKDSEGKDEVRAQKLHPPKHPLLLIRENFTSAIAGTPPAFS